MATEYDIYVTKADGSGLEFQDKSTGVTFANILATRFLFGNYLDSLSPVTLTEGDSFTQWLEYELTSLTPVVVDSKTIVAMEFFVPAIAGLTVPAGATFVTTGRYVKYVPPATYLPTANNNIFTRTPQDIGYDTDITIIPDAVRSLTYETYIATTPTPLVTTVTNTDYMVIGASGTCIYNGSTYRIGEMFKASDASAVSFTGAATLAVLSGIRYKYFTTVWNISKDLAGLQAIANSSCDCTFQHQLGAMWDTLKGIEVSDIQNWTSAEYTNAMLTDLQRQIAELQNCYQ